MYILYRYCSTLQLWPKCLVLTSPTSVDSAYDLRVRAGHHAVGFQGT